MNIYRFLLFLLFSFLLKVQTYDMDSEYIRRKRCCCFLSFLLFLFRYIRCDCMWIIYSYVRICIKIIAHKNWTYLGINLYRTDQFCCVEIDSIRLNIIRWDAIQFVISNGLENCYGLFLGGELASYHILRKWEFFELGLWEHLHFKQTIYVGVNIIRLNCPRWISVCKNINPIKRNISMSINTKRYCN